MLIVEALAGTVGGVLGILVGSPLDVVKTRMQNGTLPGSGGLLTALKSVWRVEGPASLFKGSVTASLAQTPNNFVVFGAWAQGKSVLQGRNVFGITDRKRKADVDVYLAGSYSGFTQALVLAPFEHIKVQQQLHVGDQLSLSQCASKLLRARGVRGLFRGTFATLWRDAPTFGLYFVSFEKIKAALSSQPQSRHEPGVRPEPETGPILIAGGCAGVLSWMFAVPADVVKSRIQGSLITTPPEEVRMLRVIRQLYSEGGFPMFFRGIAPCLLRAAPVNAVTFLGYELALSTLKPLFDARRDAAAV